MAKLRVSFIPRVLRPSQHLSFGRSHQIGDEEVGLKRMKGELPSGDEEAEASGEAEEAASAASASRKKGKRGEKRYTQN